jgi:hypothetical protein
MHRSNLRQRDAGNKRQFFCYVALLIAPMLHVCLGEAFSAGLVEIIRCERGVIGAVR